MAVVIETTVAVHFGIGAFPENGLRFIHVKPGRESGTRGTLYAVVRPKGLWKTIQVDGFECFFSRVAGGETSVTERVPVLRRGNQAEVILKVIYYWQDGITIGNSQGTARQKIVLDIHQYKGIHFFPVLC